MKTKGEFAAACLALGKNDPSLTELNLAEFGALLDRERAQQIIKALEKNTYVEDITLSGNLCVRSTLQFGSFMERSPSLRRLEMHGNAQGTNEDDLNDAIKACIVLESISRSSLLVKLTLREVLLEDNCPLEDFLSSTRTLLEFYYFQSNSTMTHQVAQTIGSGLAQNKSLVKLHWYVNESVDFLEEVLFGLYDHISLKTLELTSQLTKTSSLALRSLLHFNVTLESLALTQLAEHEKIPTMVSVLAGLAQNTGLKEFSFGTDSGETNATLATAWTKMLQRNTSITMLDLRKADCKENADADSELCSAVAKGLVKNSTLETLYVPDTENPVVIDGPVWQEMLESNHCLKKLIVSSCSISLEGFECIARGLSRNTSLESINLSNTDMTDTSAIALVYGLRTNKTLKYLDLSNNSTLSQSGRAAIEQLIGYNVLRELILAHTPDSVGASILASELSDNHSLEKLDLERAFANGEGSETFRALCESLRGNTTLRHLDVGGNGVVLDSVCAGALKLDTMSLEKLILYGNNATSCGITALAQSLQGPCTLKYLSLIWCHLDDTGLLKLGEALITNVSLEVLDVRGNDFTDDAACQFFELLPQMKGLREVYGLMINGDDVSPTEAVGMALLDGLRKNTKLQKVFDSADETVDSYFLPGVDREINFYLSLNRHGRMLLRPPRGAEVPSGLWPRVLAKITGPRDMSLLYYFLQNKPKIVDWNAPAVHNARQAIASKDFEPVSGQVD
jgi:Ran GTPase-activating protein (RanGAP) involved in mRNA processing and transport